MKVRMLRAGKPSGPEYDWPEALVRALVAGGVAVEVAAPPPTVKRKPRKKAIISGEDTWR